MKTTIKFSKSRAIAVSPSGDGLMVELKVHGVTLFSDVVTADQAGALLFGIEQAMDAGRIASDRANAGPLPVLCPYPAGKCQGGDCRQGEQCIAWGGGAA